MATDSMLEVPTSRAQTEPGRPAARGGWLAAALRAAFEPLASRRLTVALMIVSVLVILTFTFQLTRADIWNAKSQHFPHLFVFVPLQTYFPPAWFPNLQRIPGGLYLPSGFLLLSLLLVNLIAAHATRFRVVGRGRTLGVGLVVMAAGVALAVLVISGGKDATGFYAPPPIGWRALWYLLQGALGALAGACLWVAWRLPRGRGIERGLAVGGAVVLAGLFGLLLVRGEAAFIGDAAMRILWQLIQCAAPSLVLLGGGGLVFGRKAAMVAIHAGIALLMFNEIYTSLYVVEQRVRFAEGETVHYATDHRSAELALVDRSAPAGERHIVIPAARLRPGELIQDPQLPVDVMCVRYSRNSVLRRLKEGESPREASSGFGLVADFDPLPPVAGTEGEIDRPSGVVKLFDKTSRRELATLLVSERLTELAEESIVPSQLPPNVVDAGGRTYHVSLRFVRHYKPYTLQLIDVQQETYLGTTTPRHFSSEFQLTDPAAGIDVRQRVWMNNPLRYRNETFYQANYARDELGLEVSELQVVKNAGWMIPYFCCVLVAIGLVAQFGSGLLASIRKRERKLDLAGEPRGRAGAERGGWFPRLATGFAVALSLVILGWGIRGGMPRPVERAGLQLDRLENFPVVHLGRSKPLDSVARSLLRRSSGYERPRFSHDDRRRIEPIAWVADAMFGGQEHRQVELFRIDDPNLRNSLNLEPRAGFRYSLDEVAKGRQTLEQRAREAERRPAERRSEFDRRSLDLFQLVLECEEIEGWLELDASAEEGLLPLYFWSVRPELARTDRPLTVPLAGGEPAWGGWATARFCQALVDRARDTHVRQVSEMARRIFADERAALRDYELRLRVFRQLIEQPELRSDLPSMSDAQWQSLIFDRLRQTPTAELERIAGRLAESVDRDLDRLAEARAADLAAELETLFGGLLIPESLPYDVNQLAAIRDAYRAQDAARFNAAAQGWLDSLAAAPPPGVQPWRLRWETFYNRLAPYYRATICCLLGFLLAALGWAGWHTATNGLASAVLAGGAMIHLWGVILAVGISGRPPVTGLYSSFTFVTLAVVVLFLVVERLTRLGLGNILAGVLGAGGLLWAWNIALGTPDTFSVMVAVLDTNFWLSTHVICISIGYTATLAAGGLGAAYLLATTLTPWFDRARRDQVIRLVYGTTCFALLFSFVGTVLGGLWADDSWGRFWGWDPKENGALMIVLWNAVVLHARWGGLVRQRGLAALAVLGNVVTAWSWEGVNQLGVGLHAYGLSDTNKFRMLLIFWAVQFAIAALALLPGRGRLSDGQAWDQTQLSGVRAAGGARSGGT